MENENLLAIERTTCKEKRKQRNDFYQSVEAARPALFAFCRRLTASPWDAEDLAQETLMVAYGRLADKHAGIQNIRSYLFKVAANQWISWCRRSRFFSPAPADAPEPAYENEMPFVQDSLGALLHHLPPKERVAFVLSEVFDSKNEEIAEILGNSEGAVKAALVRAREKVRRMDPESRPAKKGLDTNAQGRVLQLAVEAFNRRDLESFAELFTANAVGNAPGCFLEISREEIKKGSLFYTINTFDGKPQPEGLRAEKIEIHGELFFGLFNEGNLDDIWRFRVEEGEILGFDCYYCCPDVLREVAGILGVQANDHGYWYEQNAGK